MDTVVLLAELALGLSALGSITKALFVQIHREV
jgi:hypothetical protein